MASIPIGSRRSFTIHPSSRTLFLNLNLKSVQTKAAKLNRIASFPLSLSLSVSLSDRISARIDSEAARSWE